MLTLGAKFKVVLFAVLGVLVIGFIGLRYADLGRFVGHSGYYVVRLELGESGGIFTNAEVTYRGVTVGRVGDMRLTGGGIEADLKIDESAPHIPAAVRAVVANRSAVGEQYVDLRPKSAGQPYLAAGSHIKRADTRLPLPVTTVLTSVDGLAASVPKDSLRTVVDELDRALAGQGPNLQILLDTGGDLTRAASDNLGTTTQLLDNGQVVLRTQQESSDALRSFSRDLDLLATRLDSSDPDLRRLILAAPEASAQVSGLLKDTDPSLGVLLGNLLTTSDIALVRRDGLEQALVTLPAVSAAGSTAVTPDGIEMGLVTTFFNPPPCLSGYDGTTYRNGLDTAPGPPLNTAARCSLDPSTGVDVRGSANAPRAKK
jgi:phospholipid/cholesterol/gamma-HCH transport system substrate-binding protein